MIYFVQIYGNNTRAHPKRFIGWARSLQDLAEDGEEIAVAKRVRLIEEMER